MAMQTTLLIVKPDGVQRGLVGDIIGRFERKGLQIVGMKFMQIAKELAERHYSDLASKPFYPGLVAFMTSSPVVVFALRGVNAVDVCRKMMGATFGFNAEPGTIRGDFGISRAFNLIHGSDSEASATRELGLFFQPGEVIDWEPRIQDWVYNRSEELA